MTRFKKFDKYYFTKFGVNLLNGKVNGQMTIT